MTIRNVDRRYEAQFDSNVDPFDGESVVVRGILTLGAKAFELPYGTGGVVYLDPEHEDAKRYPNPRKPEDE